MIIYNEFDLQNCIYFQTPVEIWIAGELGGVCFITDMTSVALKTSDGSRYLRDNIWIKTCYNKTQ